IAGAARCGVADTGTDLDVAADWRSGSRPLSSCFRKDETSVVEACNYVASRRGPVGRRNWLFLAAISIGFVLGVATAWHTWFRDGPGSAWTIVEPEQFIPYPGDGQTAEARFRILNRSRLALRVLGTNAC